MKTVIFTVAAKDYREDSRVPYCKYTLPNMMRYAFKCDSDFLCFNGDREMFEKYNGVPSWYRLEAFQQLAGHYDQYLYVDADVFIHEPELIPNIFEHRGKGVHWVPEQWCEGKVKYFPDHVKYIEEEMGEKVTYENYYNAGVMMMDDETLQKIDFSGPYPNIPLFDQCYLNYRIQTNKDIEIVPLDIRWNAVVNEEPIVYFDHCAASRKYMLENLYNRERGLPGEKSL
jgi:hypothetical protein